MADAVELRNASVTTEALQSRIQACIDRLTALSQLDLQDNWQISAMNPEVQPNWAKADRNAKDHIAWPRGKQARWLKQTIVTPSALPIDDMGKQGYPIEGLRLKVELTWWAELAEVYVDGEMVQAGDLFDCTTKLVLTERALPGQTFELLVYLVSPGHDDGALVKTRLLTESATAQPEPAFVAQELAVLLRYVQAFRPEMLGEVVKAIDRLNGAALPQDFDGELATLRQDLSELGAWVRDRQIDLIGHAHLDMAWLWPVAETWQAAERTFESVLALQEDFPELIFGHSSPALFAWIEANRPGLWQRIRDRVANGTWEIIAGMWIEPDCNLPSGESLVRQVLYGQRYVQEKFGEINRIAWLPDTFGFCQQLAQILKLGGIDYFVTEKLTWNDSTKFPHQLFEWRGLDGTAIVAYMSALIGTHLDPVKMADYACTWEAGTGQSRSLWLPGVGDHGGGPTREMLEAARRWDSENTNLSPAPLFPKLGFSRVVDYLDRILSTTNPTDLPTWDSDLYLEFHRGCYTTHADQKWQNRRAEALLYDAELWSSIATIATGQNLLPEQTHPYPAADLERLWKLTLFQQFHDILPGSAIPEVYADANADWAIVFADGEMLKRSAIAALTRSLDLPPAPSPDARPLLVFNSLNWSRSVVINLAQDLRRPDSHLIDSAGQVISDATNLALLSNIPSCGYRLFWLCPGEAGVATVETPIANPPIANPTNWTLTNRHLRATICPRTGDLLSLWSYDLDREILSAPAGLQLFRDEGQYWDAWNIDPDYANKPIEPPTLQSITGDLGSTIQGRIRVTRSIDRSTIEQDYVLDRDSPVLRIETFIDWQERHVLLKAVVPLAFESGQDADRVSTEVPCGTMTRTTRPVTPAEKAQWEIPALRWADLSANDDRWGLSLLNDSKYGYDASPSQIRLTLLRGATWPNPDADRGQHQFTYALYAHPGSQGLSTIHHARELNQPVILQLGSSQPESQPDSNPDRRSFLDLGDSSAILMALKQAEAQPDAASNPAPGWVLRCYEAIGRGGDWAIGGDLLGQVVTGEALTILEASNSSRASVDQDECDISCGKATPTSLRGGDGRDLRGAAGDLRPWEIATIGLIPKGFES